MECTNLKRGRRETWIKESGTGAHTCNPSTWEVKAILGCILSLKPVWANKKDGWDFPPGIKLWLPSYSLTLGHPLKGKPAIMWQGPLFRLTPQRNEGSPRAAISDELRFSHQEPTRPWIRLTTTWMSLNAPLVMSWEDCSPGWHLHHSLAKDWSRGITNPHSPDPEQLWARVNSKLCRNCS